MKTWFIDRLYVGIRFFVPEPPASMLERRRAEFVGGVVSVLIPFHLLLLMVDITAGVLVGMVMTSTALMTQVITGFLLRTRGVRSASVALVLGALLVGNLGAFIGGGMGSGSFAANVITLVLAAVLLDRRWIAFVWLAVMVCGGALDALGTMASFEPPPGANFVGWAVALAISGGMLAGLVALTENQFVESENKSKDLERTLGELRETSVSRDFVQEIFAAMREFLFVTDAEGEVRAINPSVAERGGWTEQELVGGPLSRVFEGLIVDDPSTYRDAFFLTREGSEIPVSLSRGALTGGQQFVWVATDLSAERAAIEALSQANQRVRSASTAKSNFLANMSHELRTPLNAIIGYSELLEDELDDPEQQADVGRIQNAAHTLLGQINGVLDLSKVEAGQLDAVLDEHALSDLLSDSLELVRPLADANGLRLEVIGGTDGVIHTDRTKLSQVLTNLLTNAVKFTPEGSVTLGVERWKRSGLPWVRFEVLDTGVGIGPESIDRVFEPFAQAEDSGVATIPGTGLGLSICRAFVEMLGGQIYVESQVGSGSRFVVEVPSGRMESLTPVRTPSTPLPDLSNTAHERVLVIDDDVRFLELMERTLSAPGRQIIATNEPRRALAWAERYRADVILLDVQMPDLDGWSFLVRLKDTVCADSPVLVVSGDADDQVATALGAVGMVTKPVSAAELRQQIAALLVEADSGADPQT